MGVYGLMDVSEDSKKNLPSQSADRILSRQKFSVMHTDPLIATSWILQILKVLDFGLLSDCKCIISIDESLLLAIKLILKLC